MAMPWKSGALLGLGILLVGAVLAVLLWQPERPAAEPTLPLERIVEPSFPGLDPAAADLIEPAPETPVSSVEVSASPQAEVQPTEAAEVTATAALQVRLTWVPDSEGPLPPGGGRPLPSASVDVDLPSFRALVEFLELSPAGLGLPPVAGDPGRFRGRVRLTGVEPRDSGERASLTVVAGPDEGRRVVLGEDGASADELALGSLHPAVQVFELALGETVLARRSLTLVPEQTATLVGPDMRFDEALIVVPRDESGDELHPAEFLTALPTLDGRPGIPVDAGLLFVGVYPADALLEANLRRQVPFRSVVPTGEEGQLDLVLERADTLRLRSVLAETTPRSADFWLLPADPLAAKSWPYQRKSEVLSESGTTFFGLARKDAVAFVRQSGLVPRHAIVRAPAGGVEELQFELLPSAKITGHVHRRGTPVAGAVVQYHARNPLAATAALLDWPADAHQRAALPLLPPSFDRTATDGKGEFALADWPRQDSDHWLELVHPLLSVPHVINLPKSGRHFEIDLAGPPPQAPVGALVLTFPEALLGSVVEVRRDGAPHAEESLADAELRIGPMALGRWRLHVEHEGRVLVDDQPLELKGLLRVEVGVTGADDPPR